jgi:hypothetical protein
MSRADDPRRSSAYVMARRRWINAQPNGTPCALCGRPVDTSQSGNAPWGPTVEHRLPVRSHPELALDQSWWALAHRKCSDRQGAQVANAIRRSKRAPSGPSVPRQRRW